MNSAAAPPNYPSRRLMVLGLLGLLALVLVLRAFDLQVFSKGFLQGEGDARHLRVVATAAHRGMITDRHGAPLAISTPVDSVWGNPQHMVQDRAQWPALARLLALDINQLEEHLSARMSREFVYLKRRINPDIAQQVMALGIPGVSLQREYRRYYPTGEVSAHVLGFTDINDHGQEGIELGFDDVLRGVPGKKRVLKDSLGRIVQDVESLSAPKPGRDVQLSIDRRIQYLAHRELKATIAQHDAQAGSAVILDVRTGEVLAMVNLPAYNPNKLNQPRGQRFRNRAVTDLFEPGSTMKPFTVAAALESGSYRPDTLIETGPGRFQVGRKTIRDIHNYGLIDVSTVIQKSSNVGATKMAMAIPTKGMWELFSGVGFGAVTGSSFPGEVKGHLPYYKKWREIERATLSFGYGLSVTPLQLAQAYAVLAGDGQWRPASFLRLDQAPAGKSVMQPETAEALRVMMERVTNKGGTGTQARVAGYRVAGKTGTVHKAAPGGYSKDKYLSLFAAMVPVSNPRLVMVIMIDEPGNKDYFGGLVAAPLFSKVMVDALRLLDVAPDDLETAQPALLISAPHPPRSAPVLVSAEPLIDPAAKADRHAAVPVPGKAPQKADKKRNPAGSTALASLNTPAKRKITEPVQKRPRKPKPEAKEARRETRPRVAPVAQDTSLAIDEILRAQNLAGAAP